MNNTTTNNTAILPHTLTFTWMNVLMGIILYSVVLVTLFGNILVLVAVYVNKNLQTSFNYYVVNLAITDLAVAVTAMSFHTTDNVLGYWPFGEFLCGVWIFFDYGMTFVSVFTLILISVDRFWSVTWSVHYRRYHSRRKSVISIMCIWLFMLVLWLPPCIYDRLYNAKPGECIWEPSLNKGFVVVVATVGHHGSCFAMLFCYARVFFFMQKRRRLIASGDDMNINRPKVSVLSNEFERTTSLCDQNKHTNLQNMSMFLASEVSQITASKTEPCFHQKTVNMFANHNALEIPSSNTDFDYTYNTVSRLKADKLRRQKRDRSIFVTLTYVIIGYAVCWIPFHIVFDISSACPTCVPRGVYAATFWMTYINSTINPFLYNFSNPEFKRASKRLLCRR